MLGQSKHIVFYLDKCKGCILDLFQRARQKIFTRLEIWQLTAGRFLSFRNCAFLSAVGMHTPPRPAAVMEPSDLMFPEAGADMVLLF